MDFALKKFAFKSMYIIQNFKVLLWKFEFKNYVQYIASF